MAVLSSLLCKGESGASAVTRGQPAWRVLEGEQHWEHGAQTGGQGHEGPSKGAPPSVFETLNICGMLERVLTNEGREVTWAFAGPQK